MADNEQTPSTPTSEELVQQAQADPNVPVVYFSGFVTRIGGTDVDFLLTLNGVPVGLVSASHAVMKTFVEKLKQTIEEFEEALGQKFLSLEEIHEIMKEKDEDDSNGNDNDQNGS